LPAAHGRNILKVGFAPLYALDGSREGHIQIVGHCFAWHDSNLRSTRHPN